MGSKISKENAKELGRLGGIKSGEAKRKKKSERERLQLLLELPLKDGKLIDMDKLKSFKGLSGQNITVADAIAATQIQKALKGDRESARLIYSLMGQLGLPPEAEAEEVADDGFIEALKGTAAEDWSGDERS